jgi:hypothetical protein
MPNPGSGFERRFGKTAGGKRTPRSGAAGGGDVSFPVGALWADWSWELKERASLPKSLTTWLGQAQSDIRIGDRRRPALALRETGGQTIVVFQWDDLRVWTEALVEIGNSAKLRTLVRQLQRQVQEIEKAIR